MKDFYDLFIKELRNIYSAEKQLLVALPMLAQQASNPKLKLALREHLKETKEQVKRLEKIGKELHEDYAGSTCEPIQTLIKDARKVFKKNYHKSVKDAAIIGCAQRVEHYEMACYGALKAYAKHFKFDHIESLLEETSKEEGHANKLLTSLAEGTMFSIGINWEAREKSA